jgi:hypothetical protein
VLGAVLGREFDIGALGATAGLGGDGTVDGLEPGLDAGLLVDVNGAFGGRSASSSCCRPGQDGGSRNSRSRTA